EMVGGKAIEKTVDVDGVPAVRIARLEDRRLTEGRPLHEGSGAQVGEREALHVPHSQLLPGAARRLGHRLRRAERLRRWLFYPDVHPALEALDRHLRL